MFGLYVMVMRGCGGKLVQYSKGLELSWREGLLYTWLDSAGPGIFPHGYPVSSAGQFSVVPQVFGKHEVLEVLVPAHDNSLHL